MDLLDFVSTEMKKLPRKDWEGLARAAGVPYGTAYKIGHRYTKRPGYSAVQKLADELRKRDPA